jgi:hypothetical protein
MMKLAVRYGHLPHFFEFVESEVLEVVDVVRMLRKVIDGHLEHVVDG